MERLFSWTVVQPYWWLAVKVLDNEHYTASGELITWEYLEDFYDRNGYWYGAVSFRLESWYLISISVSYMSLFFSLATIVDLYYVLHNPFSSSEKRVKKYMIISILMSFTLASIGLSMTKAQIYWVSELNFRLYQSIALINLFVAVLVMVLVLIRFRKKKMNENIKKQIQQRYLEFVVLLAIFAWPICLVTKPSYRYNDDYELYVGGTKFIQKWYTWLVCLFGFLVALSRLRDRLLRVKFYNMWMRLTCRLNKQVKFDKFEEIVQKAALNTFLKTSLNTELVITILKGIVILAASSSDKIDHMDD